MAKQPKGVPMQTELLAPDDKPAPTAIVQHTVDVPIGRVIQMALEKGTAPGDLEKLIALHERMSANAARQQFHRAISEFKAACPAIPRRTENSQFKVSRNGQQVNRKYAALEDIEATIRGPLGDHGLSFRWTGSTVNAGQMTMTCVVSHVGGHSESSSVTLGIESRAGCSEQQKYGSAMTYAQRYSLIQALGLTSCDEDTDGEDDPEPITEDQAANIDHMLAELKADRAAFLKFMRVESIAEIPAARFREAINALEAKRRKVGGA